MNKIIGKYNEAVVFTNNIEDGAKKQILNLLNQQFVSGSKIRIMPDVHEGMGCTIGTTMTITDKVVPNLVGVDIGCGMETVLLKNRHVELEKLDKVIHHSIPSGFSIRQKEHSMIVDIPLEELYCYPHINKKRARLSLGTLGGGNHFIELNKDREGELYLVIHSGSRHLGKQVAEYYQKMAVHSLKQKNRQSTEQIKILREQNRMEEVQRELDNIQLRKVEKNLSYLEGELVEQYLHDMKIVQMYAVRNRHAMVEEIIKKMKFKVVDSFTTIHNYIDLDQMILRKGAVSAKEQERLLIPINMRDGSLLCIGKGNLNWNYSAPHGAGRLLSRREAKERFDLSQFKVSMKGIFSSTINKQTLDEAPFAYKPMEEIIDNISDTVKVVKVLKPIYNFKAAQ